MKSNRVLKLLESVPERPSRDEHFVHYSS